MKSYQLRNDCDAVLRIIIEPEGFIYDIQANQKVTVTVNGDSSAFECIHSVDKEGVLGVFLFGLIAARWQSISMGET